jgi:two-component system cell cycle response regulator DivK
MAGELVLIVEDNERNLKLARDVLQFKGFRTLEAGTAGDGIAAAAANRPDLVLMDIQLPDMDGTAALGQLRANPATAGIRVVALTAFAMREDRERIMAAGFDAYIAKPIDVRQFPLQVQEQCDLAREEARP